MVRQPHGGHASYQLCYRDIYISEIYYALEAQGISRSSLPFRSILQPFCGYYAFGFTLIMPFILGYSVFMPGNWDTTTFFFSYTIIGVLPILFIVLEGPTSYSAHSTERSYFLRGGKENHR
ncbi:uncharacterized protein EV420DRAFT_298932 [Desarmillaria tabescens]|uniref:Amino acid permease/ SLC12A domain-containing protein n=1 Tax=Armillaria tabescens TaxID=1929756 RepID=A0AA39MJ53_ARMTA|nr:uncharacterized protein EV420DRAFT_298932 [Desarmillaria tabescens]KAK0435589.1 hypothetical protein EV420DRAFT_298932 [Desarmillaria tabescens]